MYNLCFYNKLHACGYVGPEARRLWDWISSALRFSEFTNILFPVLLIVITCIYDEASILYFICKMMQLLNNVQRALSII